MGWMRSWPQPPSPQPRKMSLFAMSITPSDLLAQIESHQAPTIVDVRSRDEYVAGHVPGAVHIPFWAIGARAGELEALLQATPPPGRTGGERTLVIYCGHGPRAWMAGTLLGLRGLRNLSYLEGHWAEWQRQGLREETGGRASSEDRER
jgi:rhodanese-related sulfurtransferase